VLNAILSGLLVFSRDHWIVARQNSSNPSPPITATPDHPGPSERLCNIMTG
jgi:hypothetical protein